MSPAGYPDWERVIRSGGDQVTIFQNHITATTTLGPFNVQQWENLMTVANTGAASDVYQINYIWGDSAAFTSVLSQVFQTINPSQLMPLVVPVAGPWVKIQIIPFAGGNFVPVFFSVFGMSSTSSTHDVNTYSGPLFNDTENMAANLTVTWTLTSIYYGNAIMHFGPDTAAMTYVRIRYWNYGANALQELYRWPDVTQANSLTAIVALPAAPIVVDYKNGAAAQFITASLMPMAS